MTIFAAHAWPTNGRMIADVAKLGYIPDSYTKKDRVRLDGNAVTPPVMTWVMGRVVRALEEAR